MCHKIFEIEVEDTDYEDWMRGELIQNAMPYLDKSQRELLISRTCDDCFNELFKDN